MLAEILVVLPDAHVRGAIARRLEYRGHLVHRAATYTDAAGVLDAQRVELVVVTEAQARHLSDLGPPSQVAFVELAETELAQIEQGASHGADPLERLVDRIEVAMRRRRGVLP